MKKALAVISAHPEMETLCREIELSRKAMSDRCEFLNEKLKREMKESLEKTKPLWLKLESLLKKNNLLPSDYNTEKHNLYFTF